MQIWIFILVLLLLFAYLFSSIYLLVWINFNFQDHYKDEDLIYTRERPDWVPKDAFLIDFHSHTRASDGLLTPRQLILWHISNGYNGMVISDHSTMESVEEAMKIAEEEFPDFLIIPGIEFTSMRVHLNLIGIKEPMDLPRALWTTKKTIRNTIDFAHEQGGVVQFNHKEWYIHKRYLPKEWYLENGIDGWEVYNGFGFIDEEALDFIDENKGKRIMFASAGTDVHDPAKHLCCYTEVLTEDRTVSGIISALKQGKTRVYLDYDSEVRRKKPEKGKLVKNQDRLSYIRKYYWLYWAAEAMFMGGKIKSLIFFVIGLISLSLIFAFSF